MINFSLAYKLNLCSSESEAHQHLLWIDIIVKSFNKQDNYATGNK